jgi:hypothetical protein
LERRSIAERFAVPHSFAPDLTPAAAMVAVAGALARILLGSALFAIWGVWSAMAWNAIPNHFWRAAAVPFLFLLFLLFLAGLMTAISAAVRALSPEPQEK